MMLKQMTVKILGNNKVIKIKYGSKVALSGENHSVRRFESHQEKKMKRTSLL